MAPLQQPCKFVLLDSVVLNKDKVTFFPAIVQGWQMEHTSYTCTAVKISNKNNY